MKLDESIEQLEKLVAEVRDASLTDDKTALGSALALTRVGRKISEGTSSLEVIIFGDLNRFKQLNDDHSHDAGDVAINQTGQVIYNLISKIPRAKAFRQSGDEFVILLERDALSQFLLVAPSLGNIRFSYKEKKGLNTAMSLGYAVSDGKTAFGDLLERAEAACQNAKALGDGKVVEWTQDLKLNPLVRKSGTCTNCGNARVSWSGPKRLAPVRLKGCPCCGHALN